MDDKRRETVLDPTYLQPGVVARGGAVALAAVGIGTGVLLACWGASMFFNTNNRRLDVLITKIEELAQRPDRIDEVVARVDNLDHAASKIGSNIINHLTSMESSLEEIKHRPVISGNSDKHETTINGRIIDKQVTQFRSVPWDDKTFIVTGWTYPNGASADQQPMFQFCYWSSGPLGGTTSQTRVTIAENGARLSNIGAGVPRLDDALKECVWWRGAS
jgi:hypothetical protein